MSTEQARDTVNSRRHDRTNVRQEVILDWKSETAPGSETAFQTIDVSESGMSLESSEYFQPDSKIIVRSDANKAAYLTTVRYCRWEQSYYRLGLAFVSKTAALCDNVQWSEFDLYGMLRVSRDADPDSIERVYKTLARRYHPDNQETGDSEAFLSLTEAFRILSNPARRQAYNQHWDQNRNHRSPLLERREFFAGVAGEQNRRFAILCLLYRQRMADFQAEGYSRLDLESLTSCTAEETGFSTWYLIERGFIRRSNDNSFVVTADGVDYVESHRADFSVPAKMLEGSTSFVSQPQL